MRAFLSDAELVRGLFAALENDMVLQVVFEIFKFLPTVDKKF